MNTRYDPKKWQYWGRWNQVMLFTSPWFEFKNTTIFRKMGLKNLKGDFKVLHGHYYFLSSDLNKICKVFIHNLERNSDWFKKFFNYCNFKTRNFLLLERQSDLKKFIFEMIDYLGCAMLIEFSDFCFEKYVSQLSRESNISFTELWSLMQPKTPTELIKYHKELNNLKKENIDDFIKKFQWVGTHAFEGHPLTKKKIFLELKTIMFHRDKRANIKVKRIQLSTKLRRIVSIGSQMTFLRTNIIETCDRISFKYWSLIKNLGEKYELNYFEIISMTHHELFLYLERGLIPKNLKQRKKKFGIIKENTKISILLGEKLKKELNIHRVQIQKNLMELKGLVAYPGKVRGFVKILQDIKDVFKVHRGDIIVASETTPDYILVLQKASAFVTNQGGITSHAAIVAREMKKPCIIGTKIATRVFKDGDYVEVDADRGIVRKI